jgi:hypothetical protein
MEWIRVEMELPPLNEVVDLCDVYSGFSSLGRLVPHDFEDEITFEWMWIDGIEQDSEPTHWRKRPELPAIWSEEDGRDGK